MQLRDPSVCFKHTSRANDAEPHRRKSAHKRIHMTEKINQSVSQPGWMDGWMDGIVFTLISSTKPNGIFSHWPLIIAKNKHCEQPRLMMHSCFTHHESLQINTILLIIIIIIIS